jgi:hypothetical protein
MVVYKSLHRNGDLSIVALRAFSRGVFTGPLPSNTLAIHVTLLSLRLCVDMSQYYVKLSF